MAYVAGPYTLYAKFGADITSYTTLGCTTDGIMLEDGNWLGEEVNCDASGQATLDYIIQGKNVFCEFTAGELNLAIINKLLSLYSPDATEPGAYIGPGFLASAKAFSMYAAPATGSLGDSVSKKYLVFPANLIIPPGYVNRISLNRNRSLIPFRFQCLPYARTISGTSYTHWYHWASTAPT